jgi:acyl carrier protein
MKPLDSPSPSAVADDIESRVTRIVAEHFSVDPGTIDSATHLVRDLGADSLDVIEVSLEVEEEFDVTVPDNPSEQAQTVGQIVEGVTQLLAAK